MQGKKIILTDDGSHSLFSNRFKTTYHSTHGAIQESNHIYINHGLKYYHNINNKNSISILEYGFGTGLNALLSLKYAIKKDINLVYHALEAYPVSMEQIKYLNYISKTDSNNLSREFEKMHQKDCMLQEIIHDKFTLSRDNIEFEKFETDIKFDIIYFDAFSPNEQSYLWERPFLDLATSFLNHNGVLITYGAKGSFKRALKSLGLTIENPPGPPGKREITRAIKKVHP